MQQESEDKRIGRRGFLGAASAGLMFIKPESVRGSAANSAVRLGLLGCGGRGVFVTESFVKHTDARVTALADLFQDQLDNAKKHFDEVAKEYGHAAVDPSQMFRGPEAYQQLVASKEVDAVYVATPVYFHPEHFAAAVMAGKHVYLEKPVGLDVPGVKRVLRAAERAKGRQSVTVGLQLRHATPYVDLVSRIHQGALGDIVCGLVFYYAGALDLPERPAATLLERRVRDWLWDKRLSGDIVVEQNVHVIDVTNWALRAHPLQVTGVSGRKGRTDRGDCNSHYNCTFTYPNSVHISFASTQFIEGSWNVAMQYFGTNANAEANYNRPVRITGKVEWEFPGLGPTPPATDEATAAKGAFSGALDDADPNKQKAFVESISSGNYLNEVDYGAESTLSAIMARMAADRGTVVTWDDVMRSDEVWDPEIELDKLG